MTGILLLFAGSCNQKGSNASEYSMDKAEFDQEMQTGYTQENEEPPQSSPGTGQGKEDTDDVQVPRQIIRNARYRMQVKDLQKSSERANRLTEKFGGYVSESEMTNSGYQLNLTLTLRVPAIQFDSLLAALGGEAMFTQYKQITSQDVTEEYTDILTRLNTKKEVRDRYIDILRNKAKTVQDVLQAEEQIRVIQEEIEAKEGRLRFLKNQVAMSTIYLEMYQQIEYQPEPDLYRESFWSKIWHSIRNGWELLQDLILFCFNIWPLILVGSLLWWRRKWLWSRMRRKKEDQTR